MPRFDWTLYLALAEELRLATPDESRLRSAVSRAYYAAYNVAVERAPAHGVSIVPVRGFTDHQACWMAYQTTPGEAQVGTDGDRLKGWRVKADYDGTNINQNGSPVDWKRQAELALILAGDLVARL